MVAATPAPLQLKGGPPEAPPEGPAGLPAGGTFLCVLASLELENISFSDHLSTQFGGRLTKKKTYTPRWARGRTGGCETRHNATRSLDTEKVGHGFNNMIEVCKTERLHFAKSRFQRREYDVHTHLYCSKHDFTQALRPKQKRPKSPSCRDNCIGFLGSALMATHTT